MSKELDLYIYGNMIKAVKEAYDQAMETAGYVLVAKYGYLIKLYRDDSFEIIKKIQVENSNES